MPGGPLVFDEEKDCIFNPRWTISTRENIKGVVEFQMEIHTCVGNGDGCISMPHNIPSNQIMQAF